MTQRKLLVTALIITLLAMALPVAAQDGGEEETPDPIELIFAANDNLLAAEYFSFSAEQSQTQNIISGVGRRQSVLTRTTDLDISGGQLQVDSNGVPQQVAMTVVQSDEQLVNEVSRSAANLTMNSEYVYVGGQLYIRVSRISGTINENAIENASSNERSQLGTNFLTGWVNITTNPEQLISDLDYLIVDDTQATVFEFLNIDALLGLGGGLNFTPDAIVDVRLVAEDEDDPDVFIYRVELDPTVMLDGLNIISLVDAEGMTGDVDLLLEELFAGLTLTQQVTIELDGDGNPILTSVETELFADVTFSDGSAPIDNPPDATGGVSLQLQLETNTVVTYSGVGREFELETPAPELVVATSCDSESLDATFTITNRGANMETPTAVTISREGAIPSESELQLEAGTRTTETVTDGEYTLDIPDYGISQTVTCVTPEEEPAEEGQ